jgi:hypothetical protein
VADGGRAGQPDAQVLAGERVADMAGVTLGMETQAIERGDAASFLTSVLQRVQAKRRVGRRFGCVIDAEDPAFQAGRIVVRVAQVVGILGD